jgi:hypothetical protein
MTATRADLIRSKYRYLFLAATAVAGLLVFTACSSPKPVVARNSEAVAIQGTPRFQQQVEEALTLLRAKSPGAYSIVTNRVGVIREAEHSGMRAEQNPPVFELNDRSAFYSVTWCAGVIAHDSFHSQLYHGYKETHAAKVPAAVWTGHEAEAKCLEHQVRVLTELGAPPGELNYCRSLTPAYADVPYSKRNW